MKNTKMIFPILTTALILGICDASALTLKVTNNTREEKYIFIQPRNGDEMKAGYIFYRQRIPSGQTEEITIDENTAGIKNYYDVTAADSDGNPNWKLTGGVCASLSLNDTPHVTITDTKGGLKTACTTEGK